MIWGTDLKRFCDLLYLYVSIFETYIFFFLFFYRPLFAILFQSDSFVNNSKFALPHLWQHLEISFEFMSSQHWLCYKFHCIPIKFKHVSAQLSWRRNVLLAVLTRKYLLRSKKTLCNSFWLQNSSFLFLGSRWLSLGRLLLDQICFILQREAVLVMGVQKFATFV